MSARTRRGLARTVVGRVARLLVWLCLGTSLFVLFYFVPIVGAPCRVAFVGSVYASCAVLPCDDTGSPLAWAFALLVCSSATAFVAWTFYSLFKRWVRN
jgi:hypothetical protein